MKIKKPLDAGYIACMKSAYRSWLNKKLFLDGKSPENGEKGISGMPQKIEKIEKVTELIYGMRPEVGLYCWNATLTEKTTDSESPIEISAAQNELKNETLQKICHGIDQMYIEQEFDTESEDERSAEAVEEAEEMVTLVLIPDTEDDRQGKPQIQSSIKNYFVKK